MTDEEILRKVIEKAIRGGYKFSSNPTSWRVTKSFESRLFGVELTAMHDGIKLTCVLPLEMFIYTHDFAKAFWDEEEISIDGLTKKQVFEKVKDNYVDYDEFEFDWGTEIDTIERWQYHLSKMVLEKERLKYLERFLNTDDSIKESQSPPCRLVREGDGRRKCGLCHSSLKWWFFKSLGCTNSECSNYYGGKNG